MTVPRLEVHVDSQLVSEAERHTRLHVEGAGAARREIFWEFQGDHLPAAPPDHDFALLALLPWGMRHGVDIWIHGAVHRDVLERAEEAMDVWTMWRPDLFPHRVALDAAMLLPAAAAKPVREAVMLFSGGVDSAFALAANQSGLLGRRSVAIRGGILVHGFDIPLTQPGGFARAERRARAIVEEQDVPLTTVRTNWREWSVEWTMGHGFGLYAVLHQFHGRVRGGVLAADVDYREILHPWGNNHLTDHYLAGAGFPVQVCGGGYTRTEKAAVVARYPAVRHNLRVCWEHPEMDGNCGTCEKCVRTQLNFLAAGAGYLPAFPRRLTPEMVAGISFRNEGQRRFFEATLQCSDGVELPPELAAAVSRVLGNPIRKRHPLALAMERLQLRRRLGFALAR